MFEIETKIRRLVAEILDPVAEKSQNNYHEIKDIKLKNEYIMKKIEEIDRTVKVDLNLKAHLGDMKKRLHTMVSY
jgi:hypothetical protein